MTYLDILIDCLCLSVGIVSFIIFVNAVDKKAREREEHFRRNANYYFYSQLHPINHDGNPFNDLPGADMIHGTDSFRHRGF